jgi:hypothetical protein
MHSISVDAIPCTTLTWLTFLHSFGKAAGTRESVCSQALGAQFFTTIAEVAASYRF